MAKKKDSEKTQTKAGMLSKKGSRTENEKDEKDETVSKKESENTPKISKNEAEGQHDDRPIH